MPEIVALVEGPTEQIFVRDVLAAHLGARGISIWGVLSGRTRRAGGVKKWEVARNDIKRTLKERRYCTTMFDFYALPDDWPGRREAAQRPWHERADHVERELAEDVALAMGASFNPAQFIPYVQLHEFEALLFANVNELAATAASISGRSISHLRGHFDAIVAESGSPEAIDDGYETCPSRRISRLTPAFRKRIHSPITAQRIRIEVLMAQCPHFGQWVRCLEALGEIEPRG